MSTSKKPSVLVTGGAGLLGSATVKSLNDQGITDIVIVDRLRTTDKWRNLVGLRYLTYVEADEFMQMLAAGNAPQFDIVFHLGACSSTTETDASYLARNNYLFSQSLCQHTLASGGRFIYASSAATYGLDTEMSDSAGLDTLRPLNAYGWSKHAFDQYAARLGLLDKMVGLKYFNVIGPGEAHKGDMRSVVAKGYDEITRTGQLTLFDMPADQPVGRDFLYVKDAATITVWFALSDAGRAATGLFNIGSGVASTWDELAASLFDAMGRAPDIRRIPIPDILKGRYQFWTKADISRLRAAGYAAPITPLSEAVDDYVKQYLVPDRRIA